MERSHLHAQALRVLENIEILNRQYGDMLVDDQPDVARVLDYAEAALRDLLNGNAPPAGAERHAVTSRQVTASRPAHGQR